jgi:hypothetical protein
MENAFAITRDLRFRFRADGMWLHLADERFDCACGEPIPMAATWRCPTCRHTHRAVVCWNCSRCLHLGTDHGEPYRVALVAAADEAALAIQAEQSGRSIDECLTEDCAIDGPLRHAEVRGHQ